MEPFFGRYKNALVLAVVLIAQLIALAAQLRRPQTGRGMRADSPAVRLVRQGVTGAVSPFERAITGMGHGARAAWLDYIYLRDVRRKDRDLQAEVDRLRLQQMSLLADARQGQRLQALLGFREQYIYKTVAAQIIGTSGSDQSRVLYLDKGAADGLRPDMPVITPDGVVGKIRDVFPHTAMVLEINDQTAGAGVILETTRIRGILRGNAAGQPQVIDLLPDERIKPGERVLTSGGDQVFPRGLAVGDVEKVAPDPQHPPYIMVMLRPAANLSRLEEVLVITQTHDAAGSVNGQDAAGVEEMQRAADAAAEALPGLAAAPGAAGATGGATPPVAHPAPVVRADRYTPGVTPPASEMQPGGGPEATQPAAPEKSAEPEKNR